MYAAVMLNGNTYQEPRSQRVRKRIIDAAVNGKPAPPLFGRSTLYPQLQYFFLRPGLDTYSPTSSNQFDRHSLVFPPFPV